MSDEDLRERTLLEGALSQWLAEKLWEHYGALQLGGEAFEVAAADDVPGYDDDDAGMVLIRRKADGKVFEVEIEPMVHNARVPAGEVPDE